jgi:type IV fimbrial biogenesis protein FimT
MRQNKGFTLIELVVTIAIGAIVLTVGIPSFQTVILNNRLVTQTNTFIGALTLARTEAIKNGANTSICISNNGSSCTGGTNWGEGWIVFSDLNGDGAVNGNDNIWLFNGALKGSNTLYYNTSINAITFNARGLPAGFQNGTFSLCDTRGADFGRFIAVARTGRARKRDRVSGDDCS